MMLDYVYGHDEAIAHAVAQMIPAARGRDFGPCTAIGVVRDGALIAGIVYSGYRPEAGVIEITTAALPRSRWLTLETIRRIHEYPFNQLGCQMTMLHVAADDEGKLKQMAGLGYAFIRLPRMYGRDADCILCLLTREEWESGKFSRKTRIELERAA